MLLLLLCVRWLSFWAVVWRWWYRPDPSSFSFVWDASPTNWSLSQFSFRVFSWISEQGRKCSGSFGLFELCYWWEFELYLLSHIVEITLSIMHDRIIIVSVAFMCLPTRLPAIITGDFPFGSKRNLNTSADGWRSVPKNKPALFTPRSSLIGWRVCGGRMNN